MTLTAAQRKRLARECRRLAYECAEGTAAPLGQTMLRNNCPLGLVLRRVGWNGVDDPPGYEAIPYDERWNVFDANDSATTQTQQREQVVFPLIALADALEEAQP